MQPQITRATQEYKTVAMEVTKITTGSPPRSHPILGPSPVFAQEAPTSAIAPKQIRTVSDNSEPLNAKHEQTMKLTIIIAERATPFLYHVDK